MRAIRCIMVCLLAVAALSVSSAAAAAPADLDSVRAELRELRMQAALADESFNEAQTSLEQARQELQRVQGKAKRAGRDEKAASARVAQLARVLYMQGGWTSPVLTMLLSDPEAFLRDAARTSVVTERQLADIRRLSATRLRLSQARAQAAAIEQRAAVLAQKASEAKLRSDGKVAEAEAVLASLKADQRRQLAREQQRERQAELAAARKQAKAVQRASGGPSRPGRPSGGPSGAVSDRVRAAVQFALAQVGKRYVRAGSGPSVFDCSGLTKAAYARAGVGLTHYSKAQWAQTRRIPPSQIRPGDLVFYFAPDASHVAIYVGNGKMVSASNPDDGVELIDYLGPWYRERFSGVGRVVT